MKKVLLLCFLMVGFKAFAQDATPQPFLFPTQGDKVVYENIVAVKGLDKEHLYTKALFWTTDAFSGLEVDPSNSDPSIQQIGVNVIIPAHDKMSDVYYDVKVDIQINCEDNKYRIRLYNISHTVQGKTKDDDGAKFLVGITAEFDNSLAKGEITRYPKSLIKQLPNRMLTIDNLMNTIISSLNGKMTEKAPSF